MTRREWLYAAAALPGWAGSRRITASRVSAITDEIAKSPAEAIEFAHQYGLRWVELREVPGRRGGYHALPEAELRTAAKEFSDAGIRVSFLNTPLLKFEMPGTDSLRSRKETPEARQTRRERDARQFALRADDLRRCLRAAQILGTPSLRVFAFSRVEEPEAILPRVAEVLGPMVQEARREGLHLLLENEDTCNVATCRELAAIAKLIGDKHFGLNWDPLNGLHRQEPPFPDGYALLPKKRIGNVQIKGASILAGPEQLNWAGIFDALAKDGYQGCVGLETHIAQDRVARSHDSMREILRLVQPG